MHSLDMLLYNVKDSAKKNREKRQEQVKEQIKMLKKIKKKEKLEKSKKFKIRRRVCQISQRPEKFRRKENGHNNKSNGGFICR